MARLDPRAVLFPSGPPPPPLPACEHYAGSEQLVVKALRLQQQKAFSFDVTIDLEDGAIAGKETEQAEMAVSVLRGPLKLGRAGVRIHDPRHASWELDLLTLIRGAADRLDYITIPKVRSADDVILVSDRLSLALRGAGVARAIPLHVLIETGGALADVFRIAALPAVEVLDFGLMDFVSDHDGAIPAEAMRSPLQFEHALVRRAKAELAAAAHAHKKVPAHNVTLDLKNAEQTFLDARRARTELGFLRMWSVHPAQIDPIVSAMSPDDGEVARATKVLIAAQDAAFGPVTLEGALYDRGSYRHYWRVLERADLAGKLSDPEARARFF